MINCFDEIENDYHELRDFILNDLSLLLNSSKGGNYATTLIIATACEVLGPLRYQHNGEREFFKNYLTPEKWRPVAFSIYDALRNGLAHSFSPKSLVQINGTTLEVGISWKEKPHFTYDQSSSVIYINVVQLATSLENAFNIYENELRTNSELCNQYKTKRNKKRETNIHNQKEKNEWLKLIKS